MLNNNKRNKDTGRPVEEVRMFNIPKDSSNYEGYSDELSIEILSEKFNSDVFFACELFIDSCDFLETEMKSY